MKRKRFVILIVLAFLAFSSLVAQESYSPLYYWEYKEPVTLNGQRFYGSAANGDKWSAAASYCEQDGWAIVQGKKVHYWLYNTEAYHDGDIERLEKDVIPQWVEDMGYVIDYDNVKEYLPNDNLANSVKALMKQRNCDVSVTLINTDNWPHYVVINTYFWMFDGYSTTVYPLYQTLLD